MTKHVWPWVIEAVVESPKTVPELAQLIRCNPDAVRRSLKQLQARGRVRPVRGPTRDGVGQRALLWEWTR